MNLFREILLQKPTEPHFSTKNRVFDGVHGRTPHYNMQGGKAHRTTLTKRRHWPK
jgi:hypothetical protein